MVSNERIKEWAKDMSVNSFDCILLDDSKPDFIVLSKIEKKYVLNLNRKERLDISPLYIQEYDHMGFNIALSNNANSSNDDISFWLNLKDETLVNILKGIVDQKFNFHFCAVSSDLSEISAKNPVINVLQDALREQLCYAGV
ncbi:MAG: hypothetical protein Q8942_19805 [Bacillota bacterium]|nr:hypothetical protein [Bacillota bacterium]